MRRPTSTPARSMYPWPRPPHSRITSKVEIELRDTGYPGSSYTLLYDPDKDALLGFYYQAVQKQNFDVVFVRMK